MQVYLNLGGFLNLLDGLADFGSDLYVGTVNLEGRLGSTDRVLLARGFV